MNASWPSSLTTRWRRWSRWAIGGVAAYLLLGFLILPPVIRRVAVNRLAKQLNRPVAIESLRLNPLTLSTTVRGLLIKDPDGQQLLSWDEVYVNFQLASLFSKAWVFKEVSTVNPFVRVQVNQDYTLNFSDLLAKTATNNAPSSPAKPLALRIDRLQIRGAKAGYTDLTPRTPFARVLGPLDVTLMNFRTDPENKNPYSFAGTTDAGEKFAWSGYFFLDPLRSEGDLSLENITLNKYAPLYEDFIRFVVKDGSVDLKSTYHFELGASNHVASVTNTSFALHSLKIAEPGNETNLVELSEFMVSGTSVDVIARRAEVGSVTGTGGHLRLSRNADAVINVVELSKPSDLATNAPGGILLLLRSVTNAVAMLLNSTSQWSGLIREVTLAGGALTVEDLVNSRPVRLEVDDIAVTAKNISNVPGSNLTATVALRWNTNGTIKMDAQASFTPPTADVQIAVENLELKPLDPYLESQVNVFVLDSKLNLNGNVRLRTPENGLPAVTFQGDARLDDFATVDGVLAEDLLKWNSVRVTGLEANLNPPVVAIKEIAIHDAVARVVIETNRTINLLVALRINDTNAPALPEPRKAKRSKPAGQSEPVVVATNNAAGPLPKLSVASVVFSNAQLRLADRSLEPAVNLSVQQLNGTVSGLSSDELQHADVNLRAKVDNVGPVEITGTVNPLGKNLTTDLKIAAHDVDLTPTSPYSGKFAGYRIAKGKLKLELAYKIVDRKLTAKNLVILDQFTFGERVESPDATKLPVKLAVAVLKDRSGKIELDVPIDGSLDDPQFHLGKVINRAIVNVLTKIVTSPFAVLGSIFGGKGEELSFVEFTAGGTGLSADGRAKLDSLAKGLYERPALQLDIEGAVNPEADREGLRRLALAKQLRTKKWMAMSKSARGDLTPEQVPLTTDEATQWIQTIYRLGVEKGELPPPAISTNGPADAVAASERPAPTAKETGKGATALLPPSKSPAPVSAAQAVGGRSRPPAAGDVTLAQMERVLLDAVVVSDGDLRTLAAERAKAVREYILQTGKAEAERMFLVEAQTTGLNGKGNRVLLQLK